MKWIGAWGVERWVGRREVGGAYRGGWGVERWGGHRERWVGRREEIGGAHV